MRQRESPQAQVGGRVGDGAQDELDGLDHRVDEHVAEFVTVLWLVQLLELQGKSLKVFAPLFHGLFDLVFRLDVILVVVIDCHADPRLTLVLSLSQFYLGLLLIGFLTLEQGETGHGAKHRRNAEDHEQQQNHVNGVEVADATTDG